MRLRDERFAIRRLRESPVPAVTSETEPKIRVVRIVSKNLRHADQQTFVRYASEFAKVTIRLAAQFRRFAHPRRRHWRSMPSVPRRTHLRSKEKVGCLMIVLFHCAILLGSAPERKSPLARERIVVGHRQIAASDSANRLAPADAIRRGGSEPLISILDGKRLEPLFVERIVVHRDAHAVIALQSTILFRLPLHTIIRHHPRCAIIRPSNVQMRRAVVPHAASKRPIHNASRLAHRTVPYALHRVCGKKLVIKHQLTPCINVDWRRNGICLADCRRNGRKG